MILVFSGTKEGNLVAKRLEEHSDLVVSYATEYGPKSSDYSFKNVITGRMDKDEIEEFILTNGITKVVDCTHPYAVMVSENIMKACKKNNTKLYRYLRQSENYDGIKVFDSFELAIEYLNSKEGNILFTTGSNNAEIISKNIDLNRVYIRVLPLSNILKKLEEVGFLAKRILGMQGPYSKEFNKVIIKEYDISYLVTKLSGTSGGVKEKIDASIESGIELIAIDRQSITDDYFDDLDKMIDEILEEDYEEVI